MATKKTAEKRLKDVKIEDSGLTAKQEAVAVALAMGESVKSISERYDVSPTRIYEWRRLPEFCTFMKRMQRDVSREIRGQLSTMKDSAIDTVHTLMTEGKEEVRLKAACYVLDSMLGEVKDAKKLKAQARKLYGQEKKG